MRTRWNRQLISAVLCGVVLNLVPLAVQAAKKKTTVTGTVEAYETYRGKVRSVFINDLKEGEFLVMRGSDKGKELLHQVGATIKATGYLVDPRGNRDFQLVIDVLEYEIIAPVDDPTAAHIRGERDLDQSVASSTLSKFLR